MGHGGRHPDSPVKNHKTRMHSSRMRTVRCSGRLGGGGVLLGGSARGREVSVQRGAVCPKGVSA